LRKENLVDAYETKVGSFEKTFAQLQWGAAATAPCATALAEVLSMDRRQQKLSAAERCQAADMLAQFRSNWKIDAGAIRVAANGRLLLESEQ
jgi:hypothetical protein